MTFARKDDLHNFYRPTVAEINLGCVQRNFRVLKSSLESDQFICPMVKANAYGHGDLEVAAALRSEGAEHLGVALIEEGVTLRRALDQGSVLVFGYFERADAKAICEYNLTPVVNHWSQLEALDTEVGKTSSNRKKIHLKFNTGMNRLGFDAGEAQKIAEWLKGRPHFQLEGVATHLFQGEDAGLAGGESEGQLRLFDQLLKAFQSFDRFHAHALNSSAASGLMSRTKISKVHGKGEENRRRLPYGFRPGINLYGVQSSDHPDLTMPLEPVMCLKSRIVVTHRLQVGAAVSYNATWHAKRSSLIGVVPIGYGDGYFRSFSNKSFLLCGGMRVPIIGTICMDFLMVDLTDIESHLTSQPEGQEVVLFGCQGDVCLGVEELAKLVGTIPYEILTHVGSRVRRVHYGLS